MGKGFLALIGAMVCMLAAAGEPTPLEVKGVSIGMTQEQVTEKLGSLQPRGLTIGGVPSFYALEHRLPLDPGVQLTFDDDRLQRFTFLFHSKDFDELVAAFASKYPSLKCQDSDVQNRAGGTFKQRKCVASDSAGTLALTRFAGDTQTSALVLSSKAADAKDQAERAKKQKDI